MRLLLLLAAALYLTAGQLHPFGWNTAFAEGGPKKTAKGKSSKKKSRKPAAEKKKKKKAPPPPEPEESPEAPPADQARNAADEKQALAPAASKPGAAVGSDVLEILTAADHLDFPQIDPQVDEALQWDPTSGKFLYISTARSPFVFLSGAIKEGYSISWNHRSVPAKDSHFQIRVDLTLEPRVHQLRIHADDGSFRTYRFVNFWTKVPSSMAAAANSGYAAFSLQYRNTAFAQLYSGKTAVSVVDLDSTKHAKLTFRLVPPPIPDDAYDGWRLTLRDERERLVGEISRFGEPPPYVDWRDVSANFHASGKYTYRMTLYRDDKVFDGPNLEFQAIEGLSLLNHSYLPALQVEPKAELGYYFFRNVAGESYAHMYFGADLMLVFWNRLLLRGTGQSSLYTPNPNNTLTYTRAAAGMRIFGQGNNSVLGNPHMFRLDIFLAQTGYTVASQFVRRFGQFALLVEPQMVLWGYHYFVPFVEMGMRADLTQPRVSFGASYHFYVRPWSMRLGIGLGYDKLVAFKGAEHLRFSILRTSVSFAFFL